MKRLLALVLVLSAAGASAAELTPDQKKAMVTEHYNRAFELVRHGDYGRAIGHWQAILELDPSQKAARDLIDEGHRKIEQGMRDKEKEVYDRIDAGLYEPAYRDVLELLEKDPSNPSYLQLQTRLERVIAVLPKADGKDKSARELRVAYTAYLGRPENLKLAYDALRYARDLDPKNKQVPLLLSDFESHHPDVAAANRIAADMPLLDYKRYVALGDIYDGRYPDAVDVCNEILSLEPDDIVSLKRMGSAYYAMGQKARAQEIWLHALSLVPTDRQLKNFLAKLKDDKASPGEDAALKAR